MKARVYVLSMPDGLLKLNAATPRCLGRMSGPQANYPGQQFHGGK
jgi:hypothetical protein